LPGTNTLAGLVVSNEGKKVLYHCRQVGLVSSHVDQQKNFCSKQSSIIAESMDRRSKEMASVTNIYTEAVMKLIEVSFSHSKFGRSNLMRMPQQLLDGHILEGHIPNI
jgi:hypothetical protein